MNAGEEKSSITTSGSIIAMPDNYDGKPENFTTFWALAKAFMSLNEKQFPTAQHKSSFYSSQDVKEEKRDHGQLLNIGQNSN